MYTPSRGDRRNDTQEPSFFAVSRALGLHHQTVQRSVERAAVEGPLAALDDRPRPGREPTITLEAKGMAGIVGVLESEGLGLNGRARPPVLNS
jgi:hypothetical protein